MKHAPAREFRDLIVWQKAHDFALAIYSLSSKFPDHELYGLVSQIRRAATSVPANIAEGWGRQSRRAFHSHLSIAHGSLAELETHIYLAQKLQYIDLKNQGLLLKQACEVGRLLNGLMRSLRHQGI